MSVQQRKADAVTIEPLQEKDLNEADRIFHLAFGTFVGLPDPSAFGAGSDYIRTRWKTHPHAFFAAKVDDQVIGSNFATDWGSVGFFGPLTIDPSYWDRGVGQRLLEPIMDCFSRWETKHAGLYTFAQSAKHVGLYQKFGFWPRFLTAIMTLKVNAVGNPKAVFRKFSAVEKSQALADCREMTDEIYPGLDLSREIRAIADQQLGDTILLDGTSRVEGLAVCHCGEGTEAGPDTCYIKFGAVRSGAGAAERFDQLLMACEQLAAARGLSRLVGGVNLSRIEAFQRMRAAGFRTEFQGVAMHRPNEEGYSRSGIFAIDDWR